jgi:uncharacterized protein (DUF2141 family)
MSRIALALFFAGLALASVAIAPVSRAQDGAPLGDRVVVVVDGLRSARGVVLGAIYASSSRWLREGAADQECRARVHAGVARCVFDAVEGLRVAFAGFHDEDEDGAFDRDLLGLPQEGYAFSNDVREPFGPPSFAAASFAPTRARPFVVRMRYGI